MAAELAGKETVSFDVELAQRLIREQKSAFLSTRVDDEATQLNDPDISLDPVGKHVARFLSSEKRACIRYRLCSSRAPRETLNRPRPSGGDHSCQAVEDDVDNAKKRGHPRRTTATPECISRKGILS